MKHSLTGDDWWGGVGQGTFKKRAKNIYKLYCKSYYAGFLQNNIVNQVSL
jgi:hypothetical protein